MEQVDKSQYRCLKCGKIAIKNNLQRHVEAQHIDTGGFRCTLCPYTAKTRHSVGRHNNQFHDGSSSPTIPEGCIDFNNLVEKLLTFEGGIHSCTLCGKKSPWRTTMVRHIESSHVENAGHVCEVCGTVAKTRHAMHMHMRRRHHMTEDQAEVQMTKKPAKKRPEADKKTPDGIAP